MAAIGFVVPIVPGKEELDRRSFAEMTGERRAEYEAARRQAGITREAVWHQETPDGTVAVVYLEADDVGAAMQHIATSREPFDSWFRERMGEVHGIDLAGPGPAPQQVIDVSF